MVSTVSSAVVAFLGRPNPGFSVSGLAVNEGRQRRRRPAADGFVS